MKKPGDTYPIRMSDYTKFILVHKSKTESVLKKLVDYGDLYAGYKIYYDIKYYETKNWIIIKFPKEFTFYDYHNLVGWLNGIAGDKNKPDIVLAVSINEVKESNSYYALLSNNLEGDTLIGVFRDGIGFSIYLPESFEANGNIRIEGKSLNPVKIREFLKEKAFNYSDLENDDLPYQTRSIGIVSD